MRYENLGIVGIAERLTASRKAASLTQEEAADYLGISRPTFIAMEKGTRRPKPSELVKLARLYKVPLDKVLRHSAAPQLLRPHLRSILNATAADQRELEAAVLLLTSFIDDYQYLEELLSVRSSTVFPPPVKFAPGPIEKFAEHCAQEERARLNLGAHQPISSLRKILEESGLHVFVDKVDSKVAGLYVFVPDFGYCILVNRVHPIERRRWTIAHEYGHFLVDRDRPGVDYIQAMQRKPESERFADSFAAAFLMPETGVQRHFYEYLERSGDFKVGDLCRLAEYFKVSVMAMTLRLESLGLVPKGSWDGIASSRVPIRTLKREAGIQVARDDRSVKSYPHRYKQLAVQAFAEEKISEGQLASFLRCSRIEAREIVDQCSEAANEVDDQRISLSLSDSLLSAATK